jgi:hypothetical protein
MTQDFDYTQAFDDTYLKNPDNYPDKYLKKLKDAIDPNKQPSVTYEKVHKVIGRLPFDFKDYIDNFDYKNLPDHLKYLASFDKAGADFKMVNVLIHQLKDEFYEKVKHWAENDIGYTAWEGHLIFMAGGQNQVTPIHTDIHGGLRVRLGIEHLIDEDYLYDPVKGFRKFWIPMTDRKFGQFLDVNGVGIADWRAGDIHEFQSCYPHAGCTLGPDDRVIMIICGVTFPLPTDFEKRN